MTDENIVENSSPKKRFPMRSASATMPAVGMLGLPHVAPRGLQTGVRAEPHREPT
jgi:hypothetical protein